MNTSLLRGWPLSMLVALMSAAAGASPVLTVDPGSYVLVSSAPAGKGQVDESYTAEVVNDGTSAQGVAATAKVKGASPKIIEGSLSFGDVASGERKRSLDTFTIRRDPTQPNNMASALTWTTSFQSRANEVPIAHAGADQVVFQGTKVTLNGSGSTDADGDALTYQWSFLTLPAGSRARLTQNKSVNPSFTADLPGTYEIQLTVSDGTATSAPDTVVIVTEALNVAPVANAGPDQSVAYGATVQLDGTGSSDANGDPLTYDWSFISRPAGSQATLSNDSSPTPTFDADAVGEFVISLVVNDGRVNSQPDTVVVTTSNSMPVADAGPDQTVDIGATVHLDGGQSSDADGNPLTYLWSLLSRPASSAALLSDATSVSPSFVADINGEYVVQLIVNDGLENSAGDTVLISTRNSMPVASAGPDQTVLPGALVTLDGTASNDPDNDPLAFDWALTFKPPGSSAALDFNNYPVVQFTADLAGLYIAQLIVNDGWMASDPDTAQITARDNVPTAEPDSATTLEDTAVLIDVVGNDTDPLGGSLTPEVTASPMHGTAVVQGSGILYTPAADFNGSDSFSYRVSNAEATSSSALVSLTVTPVNDPPAAVDDSASTGAGVAVVIDVLANDGDVDGDSLTITAVGVPANGSASTNGVSITYTSNPGFSGTDSFSYTISDGSLDATAIVAVTVDPPADPTAPEITPNVTGTHGTNGWYTSTVSVTWSVTDPESTIESQSGCDAATVDVDTAGTTFTCTATSAGGTSAESVTVKRDATGPVVAIATPIDGGAYQQNATVLSDYACSDVTAGLDTCIGPVASGDAIDTATSGVMSFAVTATDAAGNASTITHNYSVTVVVPPVVAGDDTAETSRDESVVIHVLGNDSGGAGPLSITAVTQGANGSVVTDGATVTYAPNAAFVGSDNFTYTATDSLTSAIGTVTVTVNAPVDDTPPVITPHVVGTLGENGWYVSGVEVIWTVEDPESAIDSSTGCERVYVIEDTAGRTLTCSATSAGGTASESVTIKKDVSPPAIRFPTPPPGAGYYLGQVIEADYECTDGGAGVATCEGTTADGAAIDTSTLGEKTYEVTGIDQAGNTQTFTRKYNVVNRGELIITTVAGGGIIETVVAREADLSEPSDVAVDGAGNKYIVNVVAHRVFKLDPSGSVTIAAGDGNAGFAGDGGAATAAQLNAPRSVAVDTAGNLYIADRGNNRIRKVDAEGTIITVAGNGIAGFAGDGGAATAARLSSPIGVAVDAAENLYIVDQGNHRIRKVDAGGTITTVAGDGTAGFAGDGGTAITARFNRPAGLVVDRDGTVYIADTRNQRIRRIDAGGTITTVAGNGTWGFSGDGGAATDANLADPEHVAMDGVGNLYIADVRNHRIRKIDAGGTIITIAGNGIQGYVADGGQATATSLNNPLGVAVDAAGTLYIADRLNHRVRMVDAAGVIATVAGNGSSGFAGDAGPATAASLNRPWGVALGAAANLYIVETNLNRIRNVDTGATITTVAGNGLSGFAGDGGNATAARLSSPFGAAADAAGNLYIADTQNQRIRKVDTGGTITTVAGTGFSGFSGDGGPATAARLSNPNSVAIDAAGNLYIADGINRRIRKVDAGGTITTVAGNGTSGFAGDGGAATAASLSTPTGVALDLAGNLYFADSANRRIRKVDTGGTITTVAGNGLLGFAGDGGPATAASVGDPRGVAVDTAGNLYIADGDSHRIRKVDAGGMIMTVAGSGTPGFAGDGSIATLANLYAPSGVAVDAAWNLYIADSLNRRIRKVGAAGGYIDATPPSVVANVTGTEGSNDWYTSDATVTWAVTDPGSPIITQTGCDAQSVTTDTIGVTFACAATSAGGTTTESVTIKRDATGPVVQLFTPANDETYEQNTVVNADYGCDDTLSGIATCSGPVTTGAVIDTATVGMQSFAVTATDSAGNATTITHNYTISESTSPVDAIDDAATTLEDQPVTIAVLGNDTGGGGPLSITAVTQGANGTVSIVGVNALYTPNADFNGTDTFIYTASDGTTSDSATVSVTIDPVNDAPIADAGEDQALATGETTTLSGAGSTDVDGDPLSYLWSINSKPTGSVAQVGDATSATPSLTLDLAGAYVVQLVVNDGSVDSAPDSVTVTAITTNEPPVAVDDTAVTLLGQPVDIPVLENDTDANGDVLTIAAVSAPTAGTTSIVGDQVRYTPNADVCSIDSFEYTVSDGQATDVGLVTVTVNSTPPTAVASGPASALQAEIIQLIGSGSSDPDGDQLDYLWSVVATPAEFTATLSSTTAQNPTVSVSGPGTYSFRLVVQDCGTSSQDDVVVQVLPTPTLSIGDVTVTEGDSGTVEARFEVTLSSPGGELPSPVTVDYATQGVTASAGTDFEAASGVVTFAQGSPSGAVQAIVVLVYGDTTFEADETFRVRLSNPSLATVVDDEGLGTIINDDQDPASVLTLTPATQSVHTFASANMTITLGAPAGAGGRVIDLSSSDPAVASVPASITVGAGATTQQFAVTAGAESGPATINASGEGLVPSSAQITVNERTAALSLDTTLLGAGRSSAGTATLASPAPAGGVELSLSSSDPSVATIAPASVTVAEGQTVGSFVVTGQSVGVATLRASASGFQDATINATVTSSVLNLNAIGNVGVGETRAITLSVTQAAVSDLVVTLTSNDPSVASVTPSVTIPAGQTVPAQSAFVEGLAVGGPVTIMASADGFAPDAEQATVTLVLTLTPASTSVPALRSTNMQLTLSSPAPAGGLAVNLSSDDAGIATVSPTSVTVPSGQLSAQLTIQGVAQGVTTVRATSGLATPAAATVTVSPPVRLIACDAYYTTYTNCSVQTRRIGEDLQYGLYVYLEEAPAGAVAITATSGSPAAATVSAVETVAGGASASVANVTSGGPSSGVRFWVSGLTQGADTQVTFTAPGYESVTVPVSIDPSGFVQSTSAISTNSSAANTTLQIYAARLVRGSYAYAATQEPRAGVVTSVAVTSSEPSVGTITVSPLTAQTIGDNNDDNWQMATAFDPVGGGTTTLRVAVPAGWDTPVAGGGYGPERVANVTAPKIVVCDTISSTYGACSLFTRRIGEDLQYGLYVYLEEAPAGAVAITATSGSPAAATVSAVETVAGGASASVANVTSGGPSSGVRFWVSGLTQGADTQVTFTAPGYESVTVPVSIDPSGFVQSTSAISTNSSAANTTLQIYAARLVRGSYAYAATQEPRAGVVTSVAVTSSEPSVGTITVSPLTAQTIGDNNDDNWQMATAFDPVGGGTTTLRVAVPAGWDTPVAGGGYGPERVANVTAPKIVVCDTISSTYGACSLFTRRIGEDLQYGLYVYLEEAPAGAVAITATSGSPAAATVSAVETVAGGASASVANVTSGGPSSGVRFWVSGLTQGADTQVTFTAPGYESVTVPVSIDPSGFVQSTSAISTNSSAANTTLQIYAARLVRGSYAYAATQEPRAGVVTSVAVTSSEPSVGTITVSPLTAQTIGDNNDDNWQMATAFDPVGGGTTTLRVAVPAGWDTPVAGGGYGPERVANVTAPKIVVCDTISSTYGACSLFTRRIGEDLQYGLYVYLEEAPAGAVAITATSGSPAAATVSAVETVAGGASASVANVTSGGPSSGVRFWVSGLTQGADTQVTFTAPGYESVTVPVSIDPSGFVQSTSAISTNSSAANTTLQIYAARLVRGSYAYAATQEPRAGVVTSVAVTSSEPSVGTITVSPLTAQTIGDNNDDNWQMATAFDPVGGGTTTLRVAVPAGWDTPVAGGGFGPERVANVTLPRIAVNGSYSPSLVRVGEDLQIRVTAALEVAPSTPVTMTATSSNGAILLITDVENQTGGVSDSISGLGNTAARNFWIQGLLSGPTESVTFSAPGYESTTINVAVDPSGFVTITADFSISASSADRAIVIYAARLNNSTLAYQESQEVRGGLVVSVDVTSSDVSVGTISDSPIFVQTIADGGVSEAGRTLFDPTAAGQSVIEVVPPPGWHQPTNGSTDRLVVATVTP
jgi:hypothetical protein